MKRWIVASPLAIPFLVALGWSLDPASDALWSWGVRWSFICAGLSLPSIVVGWRAVVASDRDAAPHASAATAPRPTSPPSGSDDATPTRQPSADRSGRRPPRRWTGAALLRGVCVTMCVLSLAALLGSLVLLGVRPDEAGDATWGLMGSLLSLLLWAPLLAFVGTGDRPEPADFIPKDYFDAGPGSVNGASSAATSSSGRSLWPQRADDDPIGASGPATSDDPSDAASTSATDLDTIWAAASARIAGASPPRRGDVPRDASTPETPSRRNGASQGDARSKPNDARSEMTSLWPPVDDASDAPDADVDDATADAWEPSDWPDLRY